VRCRGEKKGIQKTVASIRYAPLVIGSLK